MWRNTAAPRPLPISGRGVLPAMALRGDRTGPRLTVQPLDPPLIRKLVIVLRHDKPLTRGLRAVVDGLQGLGGAG